MHQLLPLKTNSTREKMYRFEKNVIKKKKPLKVEQEISIQQLFPLSHLY